MVWDGSRVDSSATRSGKCDGVGLRMPGTSGAARPEWKIVEAGEATAPAHARAAAVARSCALAT